MLLHLLFPDYPDGHGDDGENAQKMPAAEQSQVANAEPNLHLLFIKPQYIVYKTKKKPLYIAVFSFGGDVPSKSEPNSALISSIVAVFEPSL